MTNLTFIVITVAGLIIILLVLMMRTLVKRINSTERVLSNTQEALTIQRKVNGEISQDVIDRNNEIKELKATINDVNQKYASLEKKHNELVSRTPAVDSKGRFIKRKKSK